MNRKLFALLLFIPLVVFATDKVLGSIGPAQGIDKHDISTPAEAADYSGKALDLDDEEEKAVRRYMEDLHEQGMERGNALWPREEGVTEDVRKFLDKKLMPAVRKGLDFESGPGQLFSRCPSGYFYVLDVDENDKLTNTGMVGENQGCRETGVGSFTYDVKAKTVKMVLPGDLGMVSIAQYMKLFKKFNS